MDISLFNYQLPKNLIAQSPVQPRDNSKLCVVDRNKNLITHKFFHDISDYLTSDDVLVFNQSKVVPARLYGKKSTGGKVELLLLKEIKTNIWEAIYKGKLNVGDKIRLDQATAIVTCIEGTAIIQFNEDVWKLLEKHGHTPLPPYIKPKSEALNRKLYQTIYAKDKGSVAAPTAGFHFTKGLIKKLEEKGVKMEFVTLHVGLGTFVPVKENTIEKHKMHSEYYELEKEVAKRLNTYKKQGKRIISVGTTTTRVLETCSDVKGVLTPKIGETDIFIYPPYKYKFIDALITNFHLPKSTLLTLVSAFVCQPNTKSRFSSFRETLTGIAYQEAIKKKYRFYSYGDAMFIF